MEDMIKKAKIDSDTFVYVSPISTDTYHDNIELDNLGGDNGYFVIRTKKSGQLETLDVLAKAPSFQAAGELFDMIVASNRLSA